MTATAAYEPTDDEIISDYYSRHKDTSELPAELIRVLGNRALVRVDKDPEEHRSGTIVLATVRKNRPSELWGTVVAVGPGRWLARARRYEPVGVSKGERVLFRASHAWAEFADRRDRREHVILTEDQIIGIEE